MRDLNFVYYECPKFIPFCSEIEVHEKSAHLKKVYSGYKNYGSDHTKRKQNEYFTYLLPQTKLDNRYITKQICTKTTYNGDPIVVISNMDSDLDISTLVNQLLSRNEFSDASSIFVVVPSLDDTESELKSDTSTICIQLSKHQPSWNQNQCNVEGKHLSLT